MCTVNCTTVCWHINDLPMLNSTFSLPSVTHMINHFRPSPLFPRRTLGGAWEQGGCCSTIEMNYCELTIRTLGCEDFSKYPWRFVTFDLISIVPHPVIR